MTELPVIDGIIEQKPTKPNWLRVKLPIGEEYRHVRPINCILFAKAVIAQIWVNVGERVPQPL